jgi:hypothetical protein
MDPVPDSLLVSSGSAGNRTQAPGSVAKNIFMEWYFISCTDFKHPLQSLLAVPDSFSLCNLISLILPPSRQHHLKSEKWSYKIVPLLILVK